MITLKFSTWDEVSFEDYENSCHLFGYNCESSPEFISFLLKKSAPLKFYSYKKKNRVIASVCVDNGWVVNDHKNSGSSFSSLPIPSNSTYVPCQLDEGKKILLPFRTKCLHYLQNSNFYNTSYNLLSNRMVAIAKNPSIDFSTKTISSRNREIRNFLKRGGRFVSVSEINGDELYDIYESLFRARRNASITDADLNKEFFIEFKSHFKGHIMFLKNQPVALQLIISVQSKIGLFADFINIGYLMGDDYGALGTMIMWKNLISLHEESLEKNIQLYYSYGSMSGKYKERWCNPLKVGRVIA